MKNKILAIAVLFATLFSHCPLPAMAEESAAPPQEEATIINVW